MRIATEAAPSQLAAAHASPDSAILIAAGPGTGKTFTMVERFRWLHQERRTPLDRILAVTFSDRAAAELRERVQRELGPGTDLESAWIGTFHAVCARLLREHAYLIGVDRERTVLDEIGQRLLVDDLRERLRAGEAGRIDLGELHSLGAEEVADLLRHGLNFVLKLKGRGITPDQFRGRAEELHALQWPDPQDSVAVAELEAVHILHEIYSCYEADLLRLGQCDFDDLILTTIAALGRSAEFRALCHDRFRHILVDEFQDSNRIQMELVRLLAAPGFANVAVVGDAKQSIYGWRDAEIENIRTFPGRRHNLTLNHRSPQAVLDLATHFIRLDPEFQAEPALEAQQGPGAAAAVTVGMAAASEQEAALVAGEIERLHALGRPYSEIAVLAHSLRYLPPDFEEELRARGIPYVTSGGSGFFDREEVRDVVAMLRLVADPFDDGALVRVLQGPLVRLEDASMYPLALRRLERRGMRLRDCWDESAPEGFPEVDPAVQARATAVLTVVDRIAAAQDALTVADVLNRLLEETGYLRHTQVRAAREGPRALLNLRKVFRMAARFEGGLERGGDFVRHLDRIIEAEVAVPEAEPASVDAVRLLTIHAAKGLEFPAVFLVNLRPPRTAASDRLFFDPDALGFTMREWKRGYRNPRFKAEAPMAAALKLHRQERRRSVYVALTRAAELLYVTAVRRETTPEEIESALEDDHFAEILLWARDRPGARLMTSEQLSLPATEAARPAPPAVDVAGLVSRLEAVTRGPAPAPTGLAAARELTFSQLHTFDLCPVRYRFSEVWKVPAAPDSLLNLPPWLRRDRVGELGGAVHEALRAWHQGGGGSLLEVFDQVAGTFGLEPDAAERGRRMLDAYASSDLAAAPTLGSEVEFTLRLDGLRLKGTVDRIAQVQGRTVLIDYKTNRELTAPLLESYSWQLRIYALAAAQGVLPGEPDPNLLLYHLRTGRGYEIPSAPEQTLLRLRRVADAIASGDFRLRPEHARRPCAQCGYRPVCTDRQA